MEVIDSSLLLCEDLPTILKGLEKIKYLASFFLSKNFSGPDRAQWSSIASMLLVYIATELKDSFDSLNIEGTFLNYSVHDWISRLHKFNSITKKNKTIVRDCVYQLYLAKKISLVSLVEDPILLGALAHRINVHELMGPKVSGESVVNLVLLKHTGHKRRNFLESLYGAYKDDIRHAITIQEFSLMVQEGWKRCLKFLMQTNVKFPAIDSLLAHLHPEVVEPIKWHKVEPVRQTGLNDLRKAVYECSLAYYQFKLHKLDFRNSAYSIEIVKPFIDLLCGFGAESQKVQIAQDHQHGDEAKLIPLFELPMEIIEMILQYADHRTPQSLMCVSAAFKAPIARANLFKFHFPRKYHVQATPEKSSESLRSIYWRDISTLARWNSGKYKRFDIKESLRALDENIMVTGEKGQFDYIEYLRKTNYFWTSCKDAHAGEKHEIATLADLAEVCIIDSTSADPITAWFSNNQLFIYIGNVKASTTHVPFNHGRSMFCRNQTLYINEYKFTLDDQRVSSTRLFDDNFAQILDVNPLNDMYLIGHSIYSRSLFRKTMLCSPNKEIIAEIPNLLKQCSTMKFLDEFRIVADCGFSIDYFDARKFVQTPVDSLIIPFSPANILDEQNQRVIALPERINTVATVWDLNTRKLTGGFHMETARTKAPMVNTRFLCQQKSTIVNVYDFAA